MALPISLFVRTDENIVKMPKVALVNSPSTMPPKTRPLNTTLFLPFLPSPNNIGEIGNYPYIAGNPTPIGDERFDSDTATPYAVEYMVYVTDEGSGINVSSEETFDTIDGWTAMNASTTNVGLTNRDPQEGSFSLTFNKVALGQRYAGVEKSVRKDFTAYAGLNLYYDLYLPTLTNVVGARLRLEDVFGNARVWEVTTLSTGWQTLTFDFDHPNVTDDPGFDISDIRLLRFFVEFTSTGVIYPGVEIDDFKGTEILGGKLQAGDVEVGYARNSAWQTRFEYKGELNRWALLNEVLGEITNDSPRLQIAETLINDFNQRAIDFIIEVAGNTLTVSPVPDETFFGTPPAGTVEFSRAERTFNFSADDLITYDGKDVTYKEVGDGTAICVWDGGTQSATATFDRNLYMQFFPNPTLSKKDLSLNYALVDEIITTELSATKQINISFVPLPGTTELRYDPVPTGAPNPLVEGVDFVIDEDLPAILFTKHISGEVILSDFDVHPENPGDPDSSVRRYESVPLNYTDLIPDSVIITQTTPPIGPLVEDTNYLVDLPAGTVFFTVGLQTEPLLNNIFINDPTFLTVDFDFYINGTPLEEYTLVPDVGWINIDDPLFPGDVVTVDYVSEDETLGETVDGVPPQTPITGQYVYTPGVTLQTPRTITPTDPAEGGEFSFQVQNPPVAVTRYQIDEGSTDIVLPTDRTGDYLPDALMQIQNDYYQIASATYNAPSNTTTITLAMPARTAYTGPEVYYSKYPPVSWVTETTAHGIIPEGVSKFILTGGGTADLDRVYYDGIFIRFFGNDVYRVQASTKVNDGADLEIQLTTKFTQPIQATDTFDRTETPIPREGDDTLQAFYTPMLDIPDRYDINGDLIPLDVRFPGLGALGVKLVRNGTELTKDFDYEIKNDGTVKLLRQPLEATDDTLVLWYVPLVETNYGDEIDADYVYYNDSESGVGLRITTEYELPDTFYFRVVNNNTQAAIFQEVIETFIKQKTGQVSAGSSPSIPAASGNYDSGSNTPVKDVGDKYDLDIVALRIYEFYTQRIGYLESEKLELSGEIVGGASGQLTEDQLNDTTIYTARLFPLDLSIMMAVLKGGDPDEMIPSRPMRLQALFGNSREDDKTRIVMDKDYPVFPQRGIVPFPPSGKVYRGMNQEPGLFGGTGGFYQTEQAAGAPTTFIEQWYPGFMDRDYSNPLTGQNLMNYGPSPAVYRPVRVIVNQDTGDPDTTTPVFPPEDLELDPEVYEDWSNSSFPNPVWESVAPRDTTLVPNSYEGAAVGALQWIDDDIEAGFLAGYHHRAIVGDDTSYPTDPPPDGLGFVYRDYNEYDLLKNGTVPADTELDLINAEWMGARPVNPGTYGDNIKQQILVLNIQKASLNRQFTILTNLLAQINPLPTADPELTTVTQALAAQGAISTWLTYVQAALDDAQQWYDDVIVTAGGVATDQQIIDRWFFLTGVDATGTPTTNPLPTVPVTGYGRVTQVEDRISEIVSRLGEINSTLGYDGTINPTGFDSIPTSENLYSKRWSFLDLRVNRKAGTLFNALQAHDEYTKDLNESVSLQTILGILGG